jgi:hypothetical protein
MFTNNCQAEEKQRASMKRMKNERKFMKAFSSLSLFSYNGSLCLCVCVKSVEALEAKESELYGKRESNMNMHKGVGSSEH